MVSLLILLACLSISASAEVYKVIGADGKISYTDQPPASHIKPAQLKLPPASKTTAAKPDSGMPAQRISSNKAIAQAKVTVYYASWCGICTQAKDYLQSRRVPFEEVNVETDDGARRYAEVGGGSGVPVIWVGSQRIQGFSEDSLRPLLTAGGYKL